MTDKTETRSPGAPDRAPLNSVPVVNAIVRSFATDFLEEVEKGKGGGDLMAWLDFEAMRLNNLFLGITPTDHFIRDLWNTPDQCGMFVSNALQINGDLRHVVRDAFVVLASKILRLYQGSGGKFGDEQGRQLNGMLDDLKNALLGLTGAAAKQ